jgi:hypothetical protein
MPALATVRRTSALKGLIVRSLRVACGESAMHAAFATEVVRIGIPVIHFMAPMGHMGE